MRTIARFLVGTLFFLLFLPFLIVTAVTFQLTDPTFLKDTFNQNDFYPKLEETILFSIQNSSDIPQEEKISYEQIAQSMPPTLTQNIVETNIDQLTAFLNGQEKDLTLFLPLKDMGIPSQTNINFNLSERATGFMSQVLFYIQEISRNKIIYWAVLTSSIVLLGLIHYFLGKNKTDRGTYRLLLAASSFWFLLSLIARLVLEIISGELNRGVEPSQRMLGLIAPLLLKPVIYLWLALLGSLFAVSLVLVKTNPKRKVQK